MWYNRVESGGDSYSLAQQTQAVRSTMTRLRVCRVYGVESASKNREATWYRHWRRMKRRLSDSLSVVDSASLDTRYSVRYLTL